MNKKNKNVDDSWHCSFLESYIYLCISQLKNWLLRLIENWNNDTTLLPTRVTTIYFQRYLKTWILFGTCSPHLNSPATQSIFENSSFKEELFYNFDLWLVRRFKFVPRVQWHYHSVARNILLYSKRVIVLYSSRSIEFLCKDICSTDSPWLYATQPTAN